MVFLPLPLRDVPFDEQCLFDTRELQSHVDSVFNALIIKAGYVKSYDSVRWSVNYYSQDEKIVSVLAMTEKLRLGLRGLISRQ